MIAEAAREAEAVSAAAWLVLRSAEARGLAASEGLALNVGRLLAERLIGRALATEPALMVDLAREALRTVVRARRVVLHVHPVDAESIRGRLGELGFEAAAIDVCDDPERSRGGLRAETDLGSIDADIEPQLDRLLDVLRQLAEERAKKATEREQP
jgi:flagellar biosynthesis/type III secretory pathway protein FliH